MAGLLQRPSRHPRSAGAFRTSAIVLLLGLAAGVALAAEGAVDRTVAHPRHWAFGWDPGESGEGVTLRYLLKPGWDLSLSAGPNDFRYEEQASEWDTADDVVDDGTPQDVDNRQEQGWVRLALGGRVWKDARFAVHGTGAVTYRWSVEEYRTREARVYEDTDWDWYNVRDHTTRDSWWLMLGLRPSYAVTERFQVEFESGVRLRFETAENTRDRWWDTHPGTTHAESTDHDRLFQSFGRLELYRLRFIFWF